MQQLMSGDVNPAVYRRVIACEPEKYFGYMLTKCSSCFQSSRSGAPFSRTTRRGEEGEQDWFEIATSLSRSTWAAGETDSEDLSLEQATGSVFWVLRCNDDVKEYLKQSSQRRFRMCGPGLHISIGPQLHRHSPVLPSKDSPIYTSPSSRPTSCGGTHLWCRSSFFIPRKGFGYIGPFLDFVGYGVIAHWEYKTFL